MRIMPPAASRVYMVIWFLAFETGEAPLGDLDDPDAAWLSIVAPDGVDVPYDPVTEEGDPDDIEEYRKRWEEWQGYAAARGRPMETLRDIIEFMLELELIERREGEMGITWELPEQLPYAEDVVPLSQERLEHEAKLRWEATFREAAHTITAWLTEKRAPGAAHGEIETSLNALAAELGLDVDDARHGLATLINEDIRCDSDLETVAADATLRLTIDWVLFEEWRTVYRFVPPEERG